jgi:two-component system cell cycle response regulator
LIDSVVPEPAERPRVLLLGAASARPEGLERALTRAGLHVVEPDPDGSPADGVTPEALLVCATGAAEGAAALETLERRWSRGVPRVVVLAAEDRDGAARLLAAGAADAMAAPVHLPELCARVQARLRERAEAPVSDPTSATEMFELVREVCSSLRPDEILQALVRRVAQALDLSHCSFVLIPPDATTGRVIAEFERTSARDVQLELERYPEIREAMRTAEPVVVTDVQSDPLFAAERLRWAEHSVDVSLRSVVALPVSVSGRVAGVFLLRTRHEDAPLSPGQIAFAGSLARAAARVLESGVRDGAPTLAEGTDQIDLLTGCGSPGAFEVRVRQEYARAQRYSLSFSLVLLDIDGLREINERLGADAGDRLLAEVGAVLRREVRMPDFACRFGGDEFALILPETGSQGARRSVGRIREKLAESSGEGEAPRLTAGIVTFPHAAATEMDDLFALAEAALMRGKGQVEDRIGLAELGTV